MKSNSLISESRVVHLNILLRRLLSMLPGASDILGLQDGVWQAHIQGLGRAQHEGPGDEGRAAEEDWRQPVDVDSLETYEIKLFK